MKRPISVSGKMLLLVRWLVLGCVFLGRVAAAEGRTGQMTADLIGPGDKLLIRSAEVSEVHDKQFIVSSDGFIDLPLGGRVPVAGRNLSEVQVSIAKSFDRYYHAPQVVVEIAERKSQPVSVLGSVVNSGIYQLQGRKTLVEVLSMAGGLKPDAGYNVRISRRTGEAQPEEVRSLDLRAILRGGGETVLVQPFDVVTVPRAEIIYVIGDVRKPGGFTLGEKEHVSVIQALALAEGPTPTAALKRCTIMRAGQGQSRTSIPVDLRKLLSGKAEDIALQAEDIVVVPSSSAKKVGIRTAEAALQTVSGILIWRRP